MRRALKRGGLLIIQGYTPKQLDYGTGGPKRVEQLYTREILMQAFGDFADRVGAGFAALLYWVALEPAMLLGLFGLCLMGLGFAAAVLTYRLLREGIVASASDQIAAMAEEPSFASEP